MDQFVLFGDSLTQQAFSPEHGVFGPALSDAYVRRLDVVNRGFSGYNTSQALHVLSQAIPSPAQARVRLLTIFFGANDSRLPNTAFGPQQHVPLPEFKENVKAIASHPRVRAHKDIRIILLTPPPVDERMLMQSDEEKFGQPTLRRRAENTAKYAAAVREVGEELNVPVLDLWAAMVTRTGADTLPGAVDGPIDAKFQSLFRDGLHFTSTGYQILFEEVMKLIEKTWPDQMPERLPFVLPAWDDEAAWEEVSGSPSS